MRPSRFVSLSILLLLIASVVPGMPAVASSTVDPGRSSYVVVVPASAAADLDQLDLSPQLVLDYGSFWWLELDKDDFALLAASSLPFTAVPDAGKVQVTRYQFDPLTDGEPRLPASMRATGSAAGFRLIQLVGPTQDAWLDAMQAAGLSILQYYPHNSYLTWATAEQSAAVGELPFVRWQGPVHPAYKIGPDLDGRSGTIRNVDVMFYNDGHIADTLAAIAQLGGNILQYYPSQPDRAFFDAIVELDAVVVPEIARLDTVLWLGHMGPEPILDDEMSSQIVAGNYTGGVPFVGYFSWLSAVGYDGDDVIWAIVDTGVDYDHPDLGPHIVGGYSFPGACDPPGQPGSDCSGGGHGTHVGGIVGGDATAGYQDPNNFYYGLGVAPLYHIFAMNSLSAPSWPPAGGWQEHSKRAVLGNAIGGNNSWTTGEGTQHGYQASERTHDFMVRDGNFDTPGVAEPFIEVFSAGNSGFSGLTAPKEAKNLVVVASSRNYRVGSIDSISDFSSRGPAVDGRWVPTVAAPGEQIASARNDLGGSCSTPIGGTNNMYAYCSGTSMAAPHVSGAIVLITDWWRSFHGGADPSPAMAKAVLVNGAADMAEGNPIPNIHEGWGRIHLTNVLSSTVASEYYDQELVFDNTGEQWTLVVGVDDPSKPLKISLAWSDAPGAVGANPALVNNLDLIVENGGSTYYGNNFSGGWSQPGGSPDTINNLENVYIQNPGGAVVITVLASNISGDGVPFSGDTSDQDFALVCGNCLENPDFTLTADPDFLPVCAPEIVTSTIQVGQVLTYSNDVTLEVLDVPAGVTATLTPPVVTPPGASVLTLDVGPTPVDGSYTVVVSGTAEVTNVHTVEIDLLISSDLPEAPPLISPPDGATGQPYRDLSFVWGPLAQVLAYSLQVDIEPSFSTPVVDVGDIPTATYTLETPLDPAACYFWRAMGENGCGPGVWATPSFFGTVRLIVAFSDDMEAGDGQWTHQAAVGTDNWVITTDQSHSPTHSWHVPDDPVIIDSRLWNTIAVPIGNGSTLTFWHRHNFESSYDGAVLEISTNGGGTWTDLGPYITANGYNGSISTCCSNPLGGREAWVSDLTTWTQVEVDLSAFAGQNSQVRWRIGCDYSISDIGWYIDDVEIHSPAPPGPTPLLTEIIPNVGTPYEQTPVQIHGSGFTETVFASLDHTWLLTVTLLSSTTIDAVVPAGMAEGIYTLTLYNGDCQTATLPNAFTVSGQCITPTVALESDSPVGLGQPMHFTATITGTQPLSYTWDFGGPGSGSGLNGPTPVFTYTDYGTFTVALTAENACGSTLVTDTVEVLCDLPAGGFSRSSPVTLGQAMYFTATVTGTEPLTYSWDFGDGVGYSDQPNAVYTYTTGGVFTVTLTAENACGSLLVTDTVEVLCDLPAGGFTSSSPVTLGQAMYFTATVTGTAPLTYSWDFGDGVGHSDQPNAVYTYTASGIFTVTLTVGGPCGTAVFTDTVVVRSPVRYYQIYLPLLFKATSP